MTTSLSGAKTLQELSGYPDNEYWIGYQRGLRRHKHGESFGTELEHKLWMSLADNHNGDDTRKFCGLGYRAGFSGMSIDLAIKNIQEILAPSILGKSKKTVSEKSLIARRENAKKGGRPAGLSGKYSEEVVDSYFIGYRKIIDTDWPIGNLLYRCTNTSGTVRWKVVFSLCNGVSNGSQVFKTKKNALAALKQNL